MSPADQPRADLHFKSEFVHTGPPGHQGTDDPVWSVQEGAYLPSLRRWTRVLRSSLRCFFLAIRLRRFLTTEPIRLPLTTRRLAYCAYRLSDPARDARAVTVFRVAVARREGQLAPVRRFPGTLRGGTRVRRAPGPGRTGRPGPRSAHRRGPADRRSSWKRASARRPRQR